MADVFGPDHAPLGAEILVAPTGTSFAPYAVVVSPAGDFAVAWANWNLSAPAGSRGQVSARLFTADGAPLAGSFPAGPAGPGEVEEIHGGAAPDGSFFLCWRSVGTPGIFARRFEADGDPVGEAMKLEGLDPLLGFDIAVEADDRFLVAWDEEARTSLISHVFVRRYGPDGLPLGPRAQADKVASTFQSSPVLGLGPDGRAAVAWARGRSVPTEIVVRRLRR